MHGHSLDDKVKEVQLVHPPIIFTHARTHTRTSSHILEHLSHALKCPLFFARARVHTHMQVLKDLEALCSSVKVLGSFPFVRQPTHGR